MLLVEGHVRAVNRAVEEGRPRTAGNQPLALLPVGGLNADGFAQRIAQIEPRGQVVELGNQQNQQILPLAHGGAHGGGAHGGLHQQVEAVHVVLVHPLRGDDVVAGQLHHHGGGGVGLAHRPADDIGRGLLGIALEFRRNGPGFDLAAVIFRKTDQSLFFVGVHEAYQVGIKHHLAVAVVCQKAVEVFSEGHQLVLGDGAFHGIAAHVQHIAFQDDQRLHGAEKLQFTVPFGDQGRHMQPS